MIRRRRVRGAVAGLLALGLLVPVPPHPAAYLLRIGAEHRPGWAAELPSADTAGWPGGAGQPAGFARRYRLVATALRDAGPPYAGWADAGRTFLDFDPRGDGRAVEVLGDLDTADRIVVLVPGVDSTLADFDRGLGGVARRAPAVQARALHAALRQADPAARVAVLAWLGYDPPEGLGWAAARSERARTGARALTRLVRTLARQRPTAAITLIGHSYGALVLGLAAPALPDQVHALVTLGGVGMGVDRAAELRTAAQVWAAEAPDDWIRRLPALRLFGLGHGVRPAARAFGAHRLPVDGVHGHDGYLVPGTGTLSAVARIALHRPATTETGPAYPMPNGVAR